MPRLANTKRTIVVLASLLILTLSSCGGSSDRCYTCTTNSGGLPQEHSNICGQELLDYYENSGWNCAEEGSKSMVDQFFEPAQAVPTGAVEDLQPPRADKKTKDKDQ